MPILNWLNREQALTTTNRVPYRLLQAIPEYSYGDSTSDNMLIGGDNLEGLKALLPYYAGQVKCIYIDPPYNTHSAFAHYDDNLQHATWLTMMYPRLELLGELLAENGTIWVSIDDNEAHYLKVMMDEIFGRQNFVGNVIWQKKYAPANDSKWLSDSHDHILVYAKYKPAWRPNKLPKSQKQTKAYKNPDNDPRGLWRADNYKCNKTADERPNLYYSITNPNTGEVIWPKRTAVWRYSEDRHLQNVKQNQVWWGKTGKNSTPAYKRFLKDVDTGVVPQTLWTWEEVGHTQDAKREQQTLHPNDPFATPKPERLLHRIIHIATDTNELVLDSFLGSGTTAAVAHKMGRRYIGIEMGNHALTHCVPRLQKVIDGEQGGISKAVNWQGGGGFRFYQLGPTIFDSSGRINPDIGFRTLAAHIWFIATKSPYTGDGNSPLLGIHDGTAYYLLYLGILGDQRINGGNVLTSTVLRSLPAHDGPKVIFGQICRLGSARLKKEQIIFRQIPYEIEVR